MLIRVRFHHLLQSRNRAIDLQQRQLFDRLLPNVRMLVIQQPRKDWCTLLQFQFSQCLQSNLTKLCIGSFHELNQQGVCILAPVFVQGFQKIFDHSLIGLGAQ